MDLRGFGLYLSVTLAAWCGGSPYASATSAEDALRQMLHPNQRPQTQAPAAPEEDQQAASASLAERMVAAINVLRAQRGLRPVRLEAALTRTAQDLAQDLSVRHIISHEDSNGAHLGDRLSQHGYDYNRAVENAAGGTDIPEFVVQLWTVSPEHARNMYDPSVCEAGVGFVFLNPRPPRGVLPSYWVLDLAQPGGRRCS